MQRDVLLLLVRKHDEGTFKESLLTVWLLLSSESSLSQHATRWTSREGMQHAYAAVDLQRGV